MAERKKILGLPIGKKQPEPNPWIKRGIVAGVVAVVSGGILVARKLISGKGDHDAWQTMDAPAGTSRAA